MADACRNWLVLHSTSQCRFLCIYVMSDACKHWLTLLVGCWHLFPLAHKPYLMGGCRWPMSISLNWCTHSIGNLCVGFDDDECRRLTSHAICVQTTLDEWRLWLILHAIGQNRLANAFRQKLNSPKTCAHATFDMCKPWLMLPIIDRCRLANTRRPWLIFLSQCLCTRMMYACVAWFSLPLANVFWLIYAC